MTKSGSTIYKNIKEKIAEAEKEHEGFSKSVYGYETEIESLTAERENCYTHLATVYLPEMTTQCVKNTLKEVQGDVQKIFKAKQERRTELEDSMQSSMKKKKSLESKLEDVTEQLNQKAAERDKLKSEVFKELGSNKDYVNLSSEVKQSANTLEKNQKRLGEFKAETKEKLPAYDKNSLFTYLLNRKFDTPDYTGGAIGKIFDRAVSNVINYREMKKNYDFLRSMPQLMNIEFDKRKEEFESLSKKVGNIEKESADLHGLTAVITAGNETGKSREAVMAEMAKLDALYRQYSEERKSIDNTKDAYHQEAIKKLKGYLKGDDLKELKDMARATKGTEDDKLVQRIEDVDISIRELKDKSKEAKAKRDSMQNKLDDLKSIQGKYTKKDYDSGRSYFDDDFDINALLTGYILGRYSGDHCWGQIEDHQHTRRESSYDSDSHYGGGHSGGGGSDGGFGGGGFSSGGGFGGGGFSTGGGF
ncbi:MAG: hypothetical protein V1660_02075 [archaeon]